MNVETYIKEESLKLKNSRRKIEFAPEIDSNHIKTIKRKYKNEKIDDIEKYILVLSYTNTGWFFFTGDCFYYDNFLQGGAAKIRFADMASVSATASSSVFSTDKVCINDRNGRTYELDGCIDGLDVNIIQSVLQNIIKKVDDNKKEDFTLSEQGILSYQLPQKIKLLYLEILCNYAFINDEVIDANEYNAITKFSVRMELQGEERALLRKYMNNYDGRVKTGYLLKELKEKTEDQSGEWDAVKYCAMQDALYIHHIQAPGKDWRNDGFIGSLMENFHLHPEQLDTMTKAVEINAEMLKKDADMDELKNKWKKLIKMIDGTLGFVPAEYLFCSGSVYGLKCYSGFLKKDETDQKAKNKQRELILQELITNNQKAVNVLIGDMNYIAERLEKALQNEDRIQKDYEDIKTLLNRLQCAMQSVKQGEVYEASLSKS